MVDKKSVFVFVLIAGLFLLSMSFISAEVTNCVVESSCSPGYTAVMKMSSGTNAHGALASSSVNYNTYLCCNGGESTSCTGSNKILGLSSSTNAHAQVTSQSGYDYDVCYGDLSCTTVTGSCPSDYPIQTVSLSSTSNAHLAAFYEYPYRICCTSGPGDICGDSSVDNGEECDDGNTNSYDGCSYSQCEVEPGYNCYEPIVNGPSCCYSLAPATAWIKEGTSGEFTGGEISEDDVLTLKIFEDYCLPQGTEISISIYKRTGFFHSNRELVRKITGIANSGEISGSWLVNQNDLQSLGEGDSTVYFSMVESETGEVVASEMIIVTVNPGEICESRSYSQCYEGDVWWYDSCDEREDIRYDCAESQTCAEGQCLDVGLCYGVTCPTGQHCDPNTGNCVDDEETCDSLGYECGTVQGELCGYCDIGTEECVNGVCELRDIEECEITSASWSDAQVTEGDSVNLVVGVSNCEGKVISFDIKENDATLCTGGDDDVETNPSSMTINGNSVTVSWEAEFQDDADCVWEDNPPEYYFDAVIASESESMRSSNELEVIEEDDEQCVGIGSCSQYLEEGQCNSDGCNVGYKSVGEGVTCGTIFNEQTRCTEIVDCGCAWEDGACKPSWDTETQCGLCGNGLLDYGEECDDGNNIDGDGCSSSCEFESVPRLCPPGTTLCEDGTCSIECRETDEDYSECDYDGTCEEDEGCTCSDCDGVRDSCRTGLICYIEDSYCCNPEVDGICNPYCAFSDPDCGARDSECGNGYREFGEECDDGNTEPDDGCSATCQYEIISEEPCPEGTALCNDGTCSINCFATDDGYDDCSDSSCCDTGLYFSQIDNACCDTDTSDGFCHPYCAFSDPDCDNDGPESSVTIGRCTYTDGSGDDCEDGWLERELTANWIWGDNNRFTENPESDDYVYDDESDVWRYDPKDSIGERKSEKCQDITDKLVCPAQIKVSFFGMLQFVIAVVLIILIYFIIKSKISEEVKSKSKKKSGKKSVKKKSKRKVSKKK